MTVDRSFKYTVQYVKMGCGHIEELEILFPFPDHVYYCLTKLVKFAKTSSHHFVTYT